jgi:hypothetical protein
VAQLSRHVPPCEKSPLAGFLVLFFSVNKQKIEHQSESNSMTSWTPNPWKASLHCAALREAVPFLPAGWLQSCLSESAERTDEHHA